MSRSPFISPLGWGPIPTTLPGSLTILANGINVTGNSTITGTLGGLTGLTVASGGISVTGASTITGSLGGIAGLTIVSGGITATGNSTITGTLGGLTGIVVTTAGSAVSIDALTPNSGTNGGYRLRGNGTSAKAFFQWTDSTASTQWGLWTLASNGQLQWNGTTGVHSMQHADSANNIYNTGFLESPINGQGTPYTCVLSDSSKTLYYSGTGAAVFTIPSNASVPYPPGTILTFVNDATGATNMTIALTSDTLVFSPSGAIGSRTLSQFGRAVAEKVTTTRWIISGSGLS